MENKKLIYKLYRDTEIKPTKDLYIKPLLIGAGSLIGTFGSYFITPDNETLIGAAGFLTGIFIGKGIVNVFKYKKQKKNWELQSKRLEVFKEEAKNIVGKNIKIDESDVITIAGFTGFGMNAFNIIYSDNSVLVEKDDECIYYDSNDDKKYDISSARDVAFSIKK